MGGATVFNSYGTRKKAAKALRDFTGVYEDKLWLTRRCWKISHNLETGKYELFIRFAK